MTATTPTRTDEPITPEARALSDLYDALSLLTYRLRVAGYDHQRDNDVIQCADYALRQAEILAGASLFLGGPDEEMAVYEVQVTQTVAVEVPKTRFDLAEKVAIMQAQQGKWKTTVFNDQRSLLAKGADKVEPLPVELWRHGRNLTERLKRRLADGARDVQDSGIHHGPPTV